MNGLQTPYVKKSRRAPSGEARGALILLYHRVIDLSSDPQRLGVSPTHFREHLEILRSNYQPMSQRELCSRVKAGSVPNRAVVVTFDDGYADNGDIAAPLLRDLNVPATMFVTIQPDGEAGEFWWDELERIILRSPRLPAALSLKFGGERRTWRLIDDSRQQPSDPAWDVESNQSPTRRQGLYLILCRMLRAMPHTRRVQVLDALRRWARVESAPRASHRRMTPAELQRLAVDGLIEVGAHTMTHPLLSAMSIARQYTEIALGGEKLTEIIGQPIASFAYPFGGPRDYTPATVELVRSAGYTRACANTGRPPNPGALVTPLSDRFELPRAIVRDWDGETFARYLHRVWNHSTRHESPRYAAAGA